MIRLTNDNLGRYLHSKLYDRLRNFCLRYTPELPPEPAVNEWLQRLYNSDNNFHLLVQLDDKANITEHAVITIQTTFNMKTIQCHQAQLDKPSVTHASEIIEYLDKLKAQENAVCIVFLIADKKYVRQFEKRHGYKIFRTVLIKTDCDTFEE